MTKITEFWRVFRLYRRMHSATYSFHRAREIVFCGLPF